MKKKRAKSDSPKSLNSAADEEAVEPQTTVSEGKSFFACYLLVSLNPRFKTHTYIGFTVNPRRRIRQHNGEIGCGAWRTKKRRPWEMVLCIYGFPTNVAALQFEWAWQHPVKSLAVRKAAASFKSLSGISNKIKLAYTMLTLPSWESMNITVNFFSTKYMKHCAGCQSMPDQMKVQICSMDELPCYTERFDDLSDDEDDYIDKEEQENNDSVPEGLYNRVDSEGDTNGECGWNRGYEVTEKPCHSVTPEDQSGLSGSINLQPKQSLESVGGSDRKEKLIEEKDVISCENTGSAEFFQAACKQPGVIASIGSNQEISSTFILPRESELIDLSTPSPTCQSFSGRKKRRISNANNFIDLTNSEESVQL